MRQLVVLVSFRQGMFSSCKRKMPQIDTEIYEVFDTISEQFPRNFDISTDTINNKGTSYAICFLRGSLQRFALETLQNDSK